jgi:Ca2+/Na+ antiporter
MISLMQFVPCSFLAQETSDYQTSGAGGVTGVIGGVIGVVVGLVMIVAMWKIFSKAGQPGWAAIIPIYNFVVLCKVAGRPAWWVLLLLLCFPIFYIIICIDLARRFGKGTGFGLGLVFLGIIFFPILGFGNAQYQGAPPPPMPV